MRAVAQLTILAVLLIPTYATAQTQPRPLKPPVIPVTQESAAAAAQDLFEATTGCGAVKPEAHDAGDAWSFDVSVGYRGERDPNPILVNKTTGVASWVTRDEFIEEMRQREAHRNWYQGVGPTWRAPSAVIP